MSILRIKKEVFIILLIIFFLCSFAFITPMIEQKRSSLHSSQLTKITTTDGDTTKTDYVDTKGRKTIAADLGYATVISKQNLNTRTEKYYDAIGNPVSSRTGSYVVKKEFDNEGNNVCTTYLDLEEEPFIIPDGYAIEKREYNNDQVTEIRYYDQKGLPVCTTKYGYGKKYEYNEFGNICRIIYIDINGDPMITGEGYAIADRFFYMTNGPENGKVESEFYFNENKEPIALYLGQFGLHKEYNEAGQSAVYTYLDENGNPIVTNKGYTTVVRTFQADGEIATERYFDLDGNPFSFSEGQYGINIENGQMIYLDQFGNELFNLRNLLNNHSWLILVIAMLAVLISTFSNNMVNFILFFIYTMVIAYFTLMYRDSDVSNSGLRVLSSYRHFFSDGVKRAGIIKNIWLFIPLGAILYRLYPKKIILLIPVGMSIIIEATQYFTTIGFCEIDDMISNSLGGWIGFTIGGYLERTKSTIPIIFNKITQQISRRV